MDGPDVRWDGVSHQQIVDWMTGTPGARAADVLESRLQHIADALAATADLVNTALQRIDSGEWSGAAATVTAQTIRHLRDFDDAMSHHSDMAVLAVAGQSGNASWARSNVPPVVDTPTTGVPTGGPMDVFTNLHDHQRVQAEAKAAEERARQVMRDYQDMSNERIAALPTLTPAPRVVIDSGDTITVPEGLVPVGGDAGIGDRPPRGGAPAGDVPVGDGPGAAPSPPGPPAPGTAPAPSPGTTPAGSGPSEQPGSPGSPAGRSTPPFPTAVPTGTTPGAETPRSGPVPIGGPVRGGAREPARARGTGGGQPLGGAVPRAGDPGVHTAQPGPRTRTVVTETAGRRGGTHGLPGTAPIGPAAARADEDKDHQRRYGVPGSELFEPDHHNGLLCDPYRPGAYVAPASIGDEDDE